MRPDSIKAVGIANYLNNTAPQHRGKDFSHFQEMLADKASLRYMARAFGVDKNTMLKWHKIYLEQKSSLAN